MKITILTLFPDMFRGPFDESIVKRAKEKRLVDIKLINIRDFATDRYKSVDDHPYGGGHGMIMRVDVIDRAIENAKCQMPNAKSKTILLDPRGARLTQKKARELTTFDHLILVCGHYEGVDERVRHLVDESISIGDYVLTGGEIPAMVITGSVVRLTPGVLKEAVTKEESFSLSAKYKEFPQFTRPATHKSMSVPDILLSGDHKKIATWRKRAKAQRG